MFGDIPVSKRGAKNNVLNLRNMNNFKLNLPVTKNFLKRTLAFANAGGLKAGIDVDIWWTHT
jgi:alpha-acetolactate decarboxylase